MISETKGVLINEQNIASHGPLPLPALKDDEVLVKVHSAPINPSDIGFVRGVYPSRKPKPTFAGFEGSGIVVQVGSSEKLQSLLNQRVTFFTCGSWAEYAVISGQSVFPIPGNLTYEEAACSLVNPLTVQGFIHISIKEGYKAVIHSAAASAVGKMLVTGCKQAKIDLICIVRREEQVKTLTDLGAEHILNSSDADYQQKLKDKIAQLKPAAFFDAVGGEEGTHVIQQMDSNTTTYCYGALSGKPYAVGAGDLIFKNKVLKGFWLNDIFKDQEMAAQVFAATFGNLATRAYKTDISKTFPQAQFEDAIQYYKTHMSEGKVLLQNPNF